jgi:hypothetical protein
VGWSVGNFGNRFIPHPSPVNPEKYRLTQFNPGVDFGVFPGSGEPANVKIYSFVNRLVRG